MAMLNVPYGEAVKRAPAMARERKPTSWPSDLAGEIAPGDETKRAAAFARYRDKDVVALIAYLQRLGTDISKPPPPKTSGSGQSRKSQALGEPKPSERRCQVSLTDIMSHADLSLYPEVSLVIFLAVFAAVALRVSKQGRLRGRNDDAMHSPYGRRSQRRSGAMSGQPKRERRTPVKEPVSDAPAAKDGQKPASTAAERDSEAVADRGRPLHVRSSSSATNTTGSASTTTPSPAGGPRSSGSASSGVRFYALWIHGGPDRTVLDGVRERGQRRWLKRRAEESLKNPVTDASLLTLTKDPSSIQVGANVFAAKCVTCHGPQGQGKIGPNLTDERWILGGSPTRIYTTISEGGRAGKGMRAWNKELGPTELRKVAAFVLSLKGTDPPDPKAPEGELVE